MDGDDDRRDAARRFVARLRADRGRTMSRLIERMKREADPTPKLDADADAESEHAPEGQSPVIH